jgi:glycosyltransferase involved in cell wall biosynthesis
VIEDGETGFLVPQFSPEALAARIVDLVQREDRLQTVAATARRAWESRYDVQIYGRRIIDLIEAAVRGPERETGKPRRQAHTA